MLRDILQPVLGLLNIAAGGVILAGSLVLGPVWAVRAMIVASKPRGLGVVTEERKNWLEIGLKAAKFAVTLTSLIGCLALSSIFRILHGITQIAMTPLLLGKIPLRISITLWKGKPKIEDNPGIKRVLQAGFAKVSEGVCRDEAVGRTLNARPYLLNEAVLKIEQEARARGQDEKSSFEHALQFQSFNAECLSMERIESQCTESYSRIVKYFGLFREIPECLRNKFLPSELVASSTLPLP